MMVGASLPDREAKDERSNVKKRKEPMGSFSMGDAIEQTNGRRSGNGHMAEDRK